MSWRKNGYALGLVFAVSVFITDLVLLAIGLVALRILAEAVALLFVGNMYAKSFGKQMPKETAAKTAIVSRAIIISINLILLPAQAETNLVVAVAVSAVLMILVDYAILRWYTKKVTAN